MHNSSWVPRATIMGIVLAKRGKMSPKTGGGCLYEKDVIRSGLKTSEPQS